MFKLSTQKGFTLIEILIVVTIIGVLTGVVISVINPAKSRAKAEDSVRHTTIEKLSQGINAYRHASLEDVYPAVEDGVPVGLGTGTSGIGPYINEWPNGNPKNSVYIYAVNDATDPKEFAVCSESALSSGTRKIAIVYSSVSDTIKECSFNGDLTASCKSLITSTECQ